MTKTEKYRRREEGSYKCNKISTHPTYKGWNS
jgi:hypothetical protein